MLPWAAQAGSPGLGTGCQPKPLPSPLPPTGLVQLKGRTSEEGGGSAQHVVPGVSGGRSWACTAALSLAFRIGRMDQMADF